MDNDSKLIKYGLIIFAILIIITMFLPITYLNRPSSDSVAYLWWFFYYGNQAGSVTTQLIFQISMEDSPQVVLGAYVLIGIVIAGTALVFISCFTRSKPRLAKYSAAIGYALSACAVVMFIVFATLTSQQPIPPYFPFDDSTATWVVPFIGYYLGMGALVFGGIIIKATNWEAL